MNLLDILGRIGFDWQVALANLVNFLIIFWLLKRFAFKPMQAVIAKRREAIDAGLDQAQAAETELMMAKQKADGIISEAKQEANALVSKAKERGDVLITEAQEKATVEHDRIVADGKALAAKELEAAEAELEKKAATLVVAGVEKILGDTITKEQNETITKKAMATAA